MSAYGARAGRLKDLMPPYDAQAFATSCEKTVTARKTLRLYSYARSACMARHKKENVFTKVALACFIRCANFYTSILNGCAFVITTE